MMSRPIALAPASRSASTSLRMQAARPRPLQADLGEGRLVDRHDDRAVGRDRRRRQRREIVEGPRLDQFPRRRRGDGQQRRDRDDDNEDDAARRLAPAACLGGAPWQLGPEVASRVQAGIEPPGHQNLTFSDPTKERPQPGTVGASSNSWSKRL